MSEPVASNVNSVRIELLDSSHGRALRVWEFDGRDRIGIGRSPDQDVPIADVYVSRQHAELTLNGEGWTVKSLGRHGVILNGKTIETACLGSDAVMKLGSAGPVVRFQTVLSESTAMADAAEERQETMATNEISVLRLADLETQDRNEKVGEIVNSEFFKMIRDKARQLRQDR